MRVRVFSLLPASLKPTWPSSPMPITSRSRFRAFLSNSAQYWETNSWGTVPSGMWMFSLRMSTLSSSISWRRWLRLWMASWEDG